MPNGVICGGAVDGSNQVGAIVTCQASITLPDGCLALSAASAPPPTASSPASTEPRIARRGCRVLSNFISLSQSGIAPSGPELGKGGAGAVYEGAVYDEAA